MTQESPDRSLRAESRDRRDSNHDSNPPDCDSDLDLYSNHILFMGFVFESHFIYRICIRIRDVLRFCDLNHNLIF